MAVRRATSIVPSRRVLLIALALLALALGGVAALGLYESRAGRRGESSALPLGGPSASGQGSLVEPPTALADFALTSQTGAPVRLSDLRGRAVLLFFGFTNCPDVCPLTLGEFKAAKRLLGAEAERTAFVFVSVDGERDNAERLRAYVGAFDPAFIGLQGDAATLDRIAPEFDLVYRKQDSGGSGGYAMAHTATSFLIDPAGRLRVVFPYGTPAEALATDIRAFLANP
jgi:protein SCO1